MVLIIKEQITFSIYLRNLFYVFLCHSEVISVF